jgi:FdhE protein
LARAATITTVVDHLELLERRITALRKARPDLGEPLALQEAIIRASLTSARPPQTRPFPLPRDQVIARVRNGVPLLHDQPVWLDIHFAADLFSRLVEALGDTDQRGMDLLVHAATSGLLDPEQLFAEAFVNHPDHLVQLAAGAGVDGDLLTTVATRAVAPILQAYAVRLLPVLDQVDDGTLTGAAWTRGYCPVCGGWPLLGELRGVELAEWLRCSACGGGWRFQRLQCPYCANQEYRSLGSLAVDGEQRFRVSICERCKGYVKVGNAFDPLPPDLLPLDDVASLHLDLVAIERGYQRPVGSGFAIELAMPEAEWAEELA